MRRFCSAAGAGVLLVGLGLAPAPAPAVEAVTEPAAPLTQTVRIGAPVGAAYKTAVSVRGRLLDASGDPVAGRAATLQWRADGVWQRLAQRTSDPDGRVRVTRHLGFAFAGRDLPLRWSVQEPDRTVRSGVHVVELHRQRARLRLRGPDRVVDERSARLRVRGVTARGVDVRGSVTLWERSSASRPWRRVRAGRLRSGEVGFAVRPRVDTSYRVTARSRWWYGVPARDRHRVDNVPPGRVVSRPAAAPRPRVRLPAQRRAVGTGLSPRRMRIPGRVWAHMTGRSWHRGCPVGRHQLRLVRLNYWGFDGYRHRGEIVVRGDVAAATVRVFRSLYRDRRPIRSMYRVDRFGWSERLQGANDYRSMAADNTSAFNCRGVVGNPRVRSPHSYGRSIDLNPWENPYVTRRGVFPNRWWLPRDRPGRMVHRSRQHPVVRAFRRQGFAWGGDYSDFHHFQD